MDPYTNDDVKRRRRKGNFLGSNPDIIGSLITTIEGLPIASALPRGFNETRVAVMSAALLALAKNSIKEMEIGEFEQLYIKGSDGYLLTLPAGPEAALTVSTKRDVSLGLTSLDSKRISERFAKLFRGDFDNDGYHP